MNLIRWTPQRELWEPWNLLSNLEEEMNRLFPTSLARSGKRDFLAPEMDVREEEDLFVVKADLPGLRKEDLELSFTGDTLTLRGERKEEKEEKGKHYYHTERWAGSFQRTLEFPIEVDASKVKAAFKDGVLEITVPKSETSKGKTINVNVQ